MFKATKGDKMKASKIPKVVIVVEGGVVQCCHSNYDNLEIAVVDYDELKDSEDFPSNEIKAYKGFRDCIYEAL